MYRKQQLVFTIIMMILIIAMLGSCSRFRRSDTGNISKAPPSAPTVEKEITKIEEAKQSVGDTAKDIGQRADKIDNHSTQIEIKTPSETREQVIGEIQGIKQETQGLRQDQANLLIVEEKLKDSENQLKEQQAQIVKYTQYAVDSESKIVELQKKLKELEESNAKLLKTMMSWIAVACVVGIGACLAIGFFFKTPTAFLVAGGCAVTLAVSVAVSLYMQYIAWVALTVLGVGCVGMIIYVVYEFLDKDKAVDELVHTGEVVKTYLPQKTREKIFGNTVEPGVAHIIQSSKTKNLVKKARVRAQTKKTFGLAPSN